MLDNKAINRTKYFLSPMRPQSIIGAVEPLAQIGLTVTVRPTDCKILINNSPVFADTDTIFTEKTLVSSYERTITIRKTGKASICIVVDKLSHAHGWASRMAYNPYERLTPFASIQPGAKVQYKQRKDETQAEFWERVERNTPDTLPQSTQKDYESMREYKERIARKKQQSRYDNARVTLPR